MLREGCVSIHHKSTRLNLDPSLHDLRLLPMILHSLYEQLHAIGHAAERQGYRAPCPVHIVCQIGSDGADGQQVFGGVGQKGFGVDLGGDGEEVAFAVPGWLFGGRGEVVGEGAVSGFFEFFGLRVDLRRGCQSCLADLALL